MKKKERLIIDLSPETMNLTDYLVEETGAATRAEFFRNMLKFTQACLENNKNDKYIKYILMRK